MKFYIYLLIVINVYGWVLAENPNIELSDDASLALSQLSIEDNVRLDFSYSDGLVEGDPGRFLLECTIKDQDQLGDFGDAMLAFGIRSDFDYLNRDGEIRTRIASSSPIISHVDPSIGTFSSWKRGKTFDVTDLYLRRLKHSIESLPSFQHIVRLRVSIVLTGRITTDDSKTVIFRISSNELSFGKDMFENIKADK